MQRGEVWWADLGAPFGRRPVLILSRDSALMARPSATVAPLTRTIRTLPSNVLVGPADGIRFESVVNLDDMLTVRQAVMVRRIAVLSGARMQAVRDAIMFALDLE